MEVNQIYDLMNTVTGEVLGEGNVVSEDLGNIVDIGNAVFNQNAVDAYVKSLVNHIGKVIFVNRPYAGAAPSVLMDGWEYGSVLEKISADIPDAQENESWNLIDGASYDPNVFTQPKVAAKFFNKRVTFEVPVSITEMQVKQSFSSAEQLNGFASMIYDSVDKSMTVKTDALIERTINNMIAETVYSEYSGGTLSSSSGVRAINLLYLYNTRYSTSLTAANALTTPEFIRFAAYVMGLVKKRLRKISRLYNIGSEARFTSDDKFHSVMLSDFVQAADVFLQSSTFHDEFTKLPNADEVPYWQGSGTSYAFADASKIEVTTASNHSVEVPGILGVMFDRDALGVTNLDRRVTSNYNPKAEFYNNWYKFDAGYFNDTNENFVVFFMA
jgi:hypothetical protein